MSASDPKRTFPVSRFKTKQEALPSRRVFLIAYTCLRIDGADLEAGGDYTQSHPSQARLPWVVQTERFSVMRKATSIVIMLAWSPASAAQIVPLKDGVAALNAYTKAKVLWNTAKARIADIDCDGKPDTVLFGVGAHSVWMGMAPGNGGKPQALEFPLSSGSQNGFPARPTHIEIYPLDCDTDAVGRLEGCKKIKGCKAFNLDAGDTDPFNFYWDSRNKRLGWWRN